MGLSPYPYPVDAGVLCTILVNTVKSIFTVKDIVWYILHAIGIQVVSWEEYSTANSTNLSGSRERYSTANSTNLSGSRERYSTANSTNLSGSRESCVGTSVQEFRSQIPAINYDSLFSHRQLEQDCSVCLTEFKPKAVINYLSCGHVFHKSCLEKWLNYGNVTCPNCRKNMIPAEDEEDTCPM